MEELLANVNWLATIVGAVLSFGLGALWYSPKMFGKIWMKGVGLTEEDAQKGPMIPAMLTQALGTFGFAWLIALTAADEKLLTGILLTFTIALLIKANGLFAQKGTGAIKVEAGFVLAMAVIMIACHAVL